MRASVAPANWPTTVRKAALSDWEEQAVRAALTECEGNIAKAARRLGITRATLYHKMDRYGMRSARRIAAPEVSR
jgi:transcriptional regulator of acetoin/glycerol metabolism